MKFLDKTGLDTLWAKIKSTFQTLGDLVTSWSTTPSDTKYPSEKLVKNSLDAKADKVANATANNLAGLDANGNLTDSGSNASDFATAAQGTAADSAVQDVKIGSTSIVSNNVATIPAAAAGTKGVVEYMTSQEAASLWTNAWAAAT